MSDQKFFILFPILILVGFTAYANAQDSPPLSIDAKTTQNFYEYGDSVAVSGKIKNYDSDIHSDIALTFRVLDPSGELATIGQTNPGEFGAFSFNFIARGEVFEPSGNYSIEMSFDTVTSDIPMFFTGGEVKIEDISPPKISQLKDIEVTAETNDAVTMVTFDVPATDDVDEQVLVTCKPESGFLFGIGQTIVKCTAKDSAGNFATPMSFTVIVNPPQISIPSWVKNVAEFWCQDKIDDASFVEGIQYLIDNGIILVPGTSDSDSETQEVPQWVKNNACWWSEGSISDLDFANGLEYLVKQGIIQV